MLTLSNLCLSLGVNNKPQSGGGGDEYSAPAVTISDLTNVNHSGPLDGVVDGPTGFVSFWVKPDPSAIGVDFAKVQGGNFEMRVDGPDEGVNYQFKCYLYDEEANNFLQLESAAPALNWTGWDNLIFAWDVGYAPGSRRWALYLNDEPVSVVVHDEFSDIGDSDFNINYSAATFFALMPGNGPAPLSYADYGLWFNSSILEANSTISEVNRRKFISATGKPVDPANWPANPVVKFSGDASTFLTNQGTGGTFTLAAGSIADAASSPSD